MESGVGIWVVARQNFLEDTALSGSIEYLPSHLLESFVTLSPFHSV
jgi:hypothetical protein